MFFRTQKVSSITKKRARIERKIRPQVPPQPLCPPHALLFRDWDIPHFYHIDGKPCQTHGIYLVSVTKSGCSTVHDFETLYCQSNDSLPRKLIN
ncbi:hypothetical protein REPUB_Repub05bG0104100 [Reevesia pubescens]